MSEFKIKASWIDRATGYVSPRWSLNRLRARVARDLLLRHYEGASTGRRTQGWRKSSGDANAVIGPALTSLRENARDLVRNNPYAESALSTITDHAVGGGIVGKPVDATNKAALEAWREWAETPACDADGRNDFAGIQKLVMRSVVGDGEVLVRGRLRRDEDGIPLNLQLQVLDPDFLDTSKDQDLPTGGQIIQGVEFNPIGQRIAYWLFDRHPGSWRTGSVRSQRVPAERIVHIFKPTRPGQVRAPSWFAAVLLRSKDFDEMEDAVLMTQKIAACLSVFLVDPTGDGAGLGNVDTTKTPHEWDRLEPGLVGRLGTGGDIKVVNPPQTNNYGDYARTQLRAIATGLGVTYEDLTGDYNSMPFSAARMSWLRHWQRVEDWRWRILIPQLCIPVWGWAMQNAMILGRVKEIPVSRWTCEPQPMVDPATEGLAISRMVRNGLKSLSEALREQGYDPEEVLAEIAADNVKLDELKLVLDSDPRKMTQAGQQQGTALAGQAPAADNAVSRVFSWLARVDRDTGRDFTSDLLRAIGSDHIQ